MSGHVILDSCHNCGASGVPLFIVDVSESSTACGETHEQGPHIHVFAACEKCRAEFWEKDKVP